MISPAGMSHPASRAVLTLCAATWLFGVEVSGAASSPGGSSVRPCTWRKTHILAVPGYQADEDSCGIGNWGEAWVDLPGASFQGQGFASDGEFFCEVFVQANEGSSFVEAWKYRRWSSVGPLSTEGGPEPEDARGCSGHVTAVLAAEVWGEVVLVDGDAEAAALAVVAVSSSLGSIQVQLQDSQGATGTSEIGSLAVGNGALGVSVPITGELGDGQTRDDHRVAQAVVAAATDFYSYEVNMYAVSMCFADGGWAGLDGAACRVEELRGYGQSSVDLGAVLY